MKRINRVCVYCGSSGRVAEIYRSAATRTGMLLARAGIEVIYGGGRIGLMGLVADAALSAGGRVTGIIPGFLHDRELGHTGISELIVAESMHERKQRMFELADAFVILPGGLGTLDEAFECITWRQLGLHDRPIVLVDIGGYWQPLMRLIDRVVETGFAPRATHDFFKLVLTPEEMLAAISAAPEPTMPHTADRV
ncbi:MAG TPA: TIGR00730 family Rossman fold protein [Stellaceae bacterium]|nr:TIGR00730 family Rossman fold protein [Stellaceae bacterium]